MNFVVNQQNIYLSFPNYLPYLLNGILLSYHIAINHSGILFVDFWDKISSRSNSNISTGERWLQVLHNVTFSNWRCKITSIMLIVLVVDSMILHYYWPLQITNGRPDFIHTQENAKGVDVLGIFSSDLRVKFA